MFHRVVKTGRDETGCGRWSYITFNGKGNNQITVINAYRVSSQSDPGDTITPRQQQCIQYADDELRPYVLDPNNQTIIDLQYFIQELQQEGEEVILFRDENQYDQHMYRPQEHNACFKTRKEFHIDGSIDGSLSTFISNCGLTNTLMDVYAEQVPNTHVRESKQIDVALVMYGIRPCNKAIGLLDESILKSDHREILIYLDLLLLFGAAPERLERPQFRNLKLDDPWISDSYRKMLHKNYNVTTYINVLKIYLKGARQMIGILKMNTPTKL
jgi:hypothetical protein